MAWGQSVAIPPTVSVVLSMTVVVVDAGTTRSVRTVVVVAVVVAAETVSVIDEIAVAGIVETVVVVVWNVDCGMVRQEQAVEMAEEANCWRKGGSLIPRSC